ncbi:MAG: TonB family protein [Deltaproteobacteria bacterium]|nr:TonB family protein [Deltaproteobacteria bacterium]
MKLPGRDACGGMLASLFLHLMAAAAVLGVAVPGPARTPAVIDLSLLPPAGPGGSVLPAPPASGSGGGPVRDSGRPARAAEPPPPVEPFVDGPSSTAPLSPAVLEETAPEPARAASSPSAPSREYGPGPLSAPFPPTRQGASAHPGPLPGNGDPGEGYGYLREAIQRGIAYPVMARKMGWEGRVVVEFQILPDGTVRDVRVARGSGFAVLDRNAVEAVRSAAPFPRPPAGAKVLTPVVYKLN